MAERGAELAASLAHGSSEAGPDARVIEHIRDATRDDVARILGARAAGLVEVRSLIVAPLVAHGAPTGTLVLGRSDRNHEPSEVAFADELAQRAAVALDHARRFHGEGCGATAR